MKLFNQTPLIVGAMTAIAFPLTTGTLFTEGSRFGSLNRFRANKDRVRLDFLYSTDGITLSDYNNVSFRVKAAAGDAKSGGSCSSAIQSGNGFKAALYDATGSTWLTPAIASGAGIQEIGSVTQGINPPNTLDIAEDGDGIPPGSTFFHLSIREINGVYSTPSPTCSSIQLEWVELELLKNLR